MPFKDANDCLKAGLSAEAMRGCLSAAREFAPEKIKNPKLFHDEFMEDWFETPLEAGLDLPFEFPFRIRHGELTVWTGFGKQGKSKLLSHVMVHLMGQGERVAVASLEVRTRRTLNGFSRQAWGGLIWDRREAPLNPGRTLAAEEAEARETAEGVLDWLGNSLWFFDHVGIVQWRSLLDDFLFMRRRYGVRQFVIDSLMRLGIMEDDYAGQDQFVKTAATWAQDNDAHVHLVAHKKKNEKGEKHGGGGDNSEVKGAVGIVNNAHNIVEVWRNVDKGQKLSELKNKRDVGILSAEEFEPKLAELRALPDGKFILRGQREGEVQEGSKLLWYLWRAFQYTDFKPGDPRHKPHCYAALAGRNFSDS